MSCVLIIYVSGDTYVLKSHLNNRFFEKLSMAILFTLRIFNRNLLRKNHRRNTFPKHLNHLDLLIKPLGLSMLILDMWPDERSDHNVVLRLNAGYVPKISLFSSSLGYLLRLSIFCALERISLEHLLCFWTFLAWASFSLRKVLLEYLLRLNTLFAVLGWLSNAASI